jgi:hypothetical protein
LKSAPDGSSIPLALSTQTGLDSDPSPKLNSIYSRDQEALERLVERLLSP